MLKEKCAANPRSCELAKPPIHPPHHKTQRTFQRGEEEEGRGDAQMYPVNHVFTPMWNEQEEDEGKQTGICQQTKLAQFHRRSSDWRTKHLRKVLEQSEKKCKKTKQNDDDEAYLFECERESLLVRREEEEKRSAKYIEIYKTIHNKILQLVYGCKLSKEIVADRGFVRFADYIFREEIIWGGWNLWNHEKKNSK